MSDLTVAAAPENRDLESVVRGPGILRSLLIRYRAPLLAAGALAASVALGWVTSGRFGTDSGTMAMDAGVVRGARAPASRAGRPAAESDEQGSNASARAVSAPLARGLFATHSWHVDPPPPPPAPPIAPPPPTAPPFPYAFVGAYTQGTDTVYFLSREDRVIDVHVGDHLDGTYVFESADAAALVFNYTPLNIRQSIPVAKP